MTEPVTSRPRLFLFAEALVLGGCFVFAFRFPALSGRGYLEAILAFLFPVLLVIRLLQGRRPGWSYLGIAGGLATLYAWVPGTLEAQGPMPFLAALGATLLLCLWEALGLLLVALVARWMFRRSGPWAAALGAALGILIWEAHGFHVYVWSWGAAMGGLPWLARSAAFLTTYGIAALLWGGGALAAAFWVQGQKRKAAWVPACVLGIFIALGGAWKLLPREPERILDVVIIQPNFNPGEATAWMEAEMWGLSDRKLQEAGLPRKDAATLLLWSESSVMGRDDGGPDPHLVHAAKHRGIAWLFGTEGNRGLLNLVRGEAAGQPSFLQAKVEPMPFGERMPGPAWLRHWLDDLMERRSQEPGMLGPDSSFTFPTPQGPLRVRPVLCSEALDSRLVRKGLELAGGQLLTSHTNDGWFEKSIATDLHGAQIRLRSVELGLPLLRATLTGKSGLFREDGTWALWGEPRTRADYAFTLRWQPIRTPARSRYLVPFMEGLLVFSALLLAWRLQRSTHE